MLRTQRRPEDWTAGFIIDVHRQIFSKYFPSQAGNFRLGEAIFGKRAAAASGKIGSLFQQIVLDTSDSLKTIRKADLQDAFLTAADLHARMIDLHPFVDGNGRWARAVTNAFIRDAGFESGTIVRRNRKKDYIDAIDRALDNGERGDLATIFIEGYLEQTEVRNRTTRRFKP